MKTKEPKQYIFVIDTDSYAGNFERQMVAYITGCIGDCGVGEEERDLFAAETGTPDLFENYIEGVPDEHGCCRPASIWPTPGYFNHGMGEHFKEGDEAAALKDYVKACERDFKEKSKTSNYIRTKLEAGEKYANWTIKAVEDQEKRDKKDLQQRINIKAVNKFPAYLSVAAFFHKQPTAEMILLMKERALKFCGLLVSDYKDGMIPRGIKVSGFRPLEKEVVFTEIDIKNEN